MELRGLLPVMCYSKPLGNLRYAFTCDLLLNDEIIWCRGSRHEGIMSTTMALISVSNN